MTPEGDQPLSSDQLLEKEWATIADRRSKCRAAFLAPSPTCYVTSVYRALRERDKSTEGYFRAVDGNARPKVPEGLAGLALSGGGVRSATFNLGVLQRLHELGLLHKLDYVSVVSGGGYIGCGLTAYVTAARDNVFPFWPPHETDTETNKSGENFALRHLRRFSSYLVAGGWADALVAALTAVGGTLANLVVILPYLLLFAVLAVVQLRFVEAKTSMMITLGSSGAALFVAILYAWAQARRWATTRSWGERESLGRRAAGIASLMILAAIWMMQPTLLQFADDARQMTWPKLTAVVTGGLAAGLLSAARFVLSSPNLRRPAIALLLVAVMLALLWLIFAALGVTLLQLDQAIGTTLMAAVGFAVGIALILLGRLLPTNCGSLHAFYRDRLSKAYFFKPREQGAFFLHQFDDCQLSQADLEHSPYLLVNACLNVSDTPSRSEDLTKEYVRPGRLGTFFLFSPHGVGNESLGYVSAYAFEKENELTGSLATAMAISGAAFGPNMGYNTNRAAVFLLTLLNARTGCWLRFPAKKGARGPLQRLIGNYAYLTLFREAASRFDSESGQLLLSDGGHVDNLGLYQLLRRRCSLVIASDAEADPNYAFEGLASAVRLAKIDLDINVEIDYSHLSAIRDGKRSFAVGQIQYPDGPEGTLIYLKSSLTDEARRDVSLLSYQRSSGSFPHETTADQFFSEQQFEAYRSLGYFVCMRTFEGPQLP